MNLLLGVKRIVGDLVRITGCVANFPNREKTELEQSCLLG